MKQELTFERIVEGEVYADRDIDVLPAMHGFLQAASWTVPRVAFTDWQVPAGGIHARQTWEKIHELPSPSVRLKIVAVRKYVSKDRPYVVFESTLSDRAGKLLGRGEMTILWPG
jgi:hypothetical protein